MRFFEAVQQLRELPQWEWAIVRNDLLEADEDTRDRLTGDPELFGFAILADELVPVSFDELYKSSKQVHSKHFLSCDRNGPFLSDFDSDCWLLTRAGSNR